MFSNFAWSEILVIAVVAIIVVGPKDLPAMLRTFGKTLGSIKRMAGDFQRQFNDAIKDAEMDDLKDIASTKGFAPLEDAKKSMEEFAQTMQDPVKTEPAKEAGTPEPAAKAKTTKKTAAKKAAPRKTTAKTASKANGAGKPAAASKAAPKRAAATKAAPKRAAPKKTAASANKTKAEAKSTS